MTMFWIEILPEITIVAGLSRSVPSEMNDTLFFVIFCSKHPEGSTETGMIRPTNICSVVLLVVDADDHNC